MVDLQPDRCFFLYFDFYADGHSRETFSEKPDFMCSNESLLTNGRCIWPIGDFYRFLGYPAVFRTYSFYVYDAYLEAGGDAWPEEFERLWSAETPELFVQQRRELDALYYAYVSPGNIPPGAFVPKSLK